MEHVQSGRSERLLLVVDSSGLLCVQLEERLNGVHLDAASVKSVATSGSSSSSGGGAGTAAGDEPRDSDVDITGTLEWKNQQKHIFVLSESGKPVYSRFVLV